MPGASYDGALVLLPPEENREGGSSAISTEEMRSHFFGSCEFAERASEVKLASLSPCVEVTRDCLYHSQGSYFFFSTLILSVRLPLGFQVGISLLKFTSQRPSVFEYNLFRSQCLVQQPALITRRR
jgi:hypothetical protein